MLSQIWKLKLSAAELPDLRNSLSEQEQQEFDSKYGYLLAQIRDKHDKKYDEFVAQQKKDAEEKEKQRTQEDEKVSHTMDSINSTIDKIGMIFDTVIDANNRAKAELEQTISLDDFYKYYDAENENDLKIVFKFTTALVSRIESFGCDENDYYEDAKAHFISLLRNHPDKHVSAVSSVFTAIKVAQSVVLETSKNLWVSDTSSGK